METAKIYEDGDSQIVCFPEHIRLSVDEVVVQQVGEAILLLPKDMLNQTFTGE